MQGRGGYDADARALFARFTTPPTSARKKIINDLIVALKGAGVWSKLDILYVMAAHDAQAARQNWITDACNLSEVNAPSFTIDEGYSTDVTGSKYLTTNYNPGDGGEHHYKLNDAHLGIWSKTSGSLANAVDLGARVSSTNSRATIITRSAGNAFDASINQNAAFNAATINDGSGHFVGVRRGSGAVESYKNGTSIATGSNASTAIPNLEWLIGACNQAGTPTLFSTRQYSFAHAGAQLSGTEVDAIYDAFSTFLDAINPFGAEFDDFGFSFSGADQHRGGVCAPNGKSFMIRREYPIFTIVRQDGSVDQKHMGLEGVTLNTSGGCVGADGKIYSGPRDSEFVLIIDPEIEEARTETFGGLIPAGQNKWTDAVLGDDGIVYCIPSIAQEILRIDTNGPTPTASMSNMGASWDPGGDTTGHIMWVSGLRVPDGRIFCTPYNASSVLIIDPAAGTAEIETFGLTFGGVGTNLWTGAALGDDGLMYCPPRSGGDILVVDPVNMTAFRTDYGLNLSGNDMWARAVNLGNGWIVALPSRSDSALAINTSEQRARLIPVAGISALTDPAFIGGVRHSNGKVYCPPRFAEKMMILTPRAT